MATRRGKKPRGRLSVWRSRKRQILLGGEGSIPDGGERPGPGAVHPPPLSALLAPGSERRPPSVPPALTDGAAGTAPPGPVGLVKFMAEFTSDYRLLGGGPTGRSPPPPTRTGRPVRRGAARSKLPPQEPPPPANPPPTNPPPPNQVSGNPRAWLLPISLGSLSNPICSSVQRNLLPSKRASGSSFCPLLYSQVSVTSIVLGVRAWIPGGGVAFFSSGSF